MSAAIVAMGIAAVEAELALWARRRGDTGRDRRHGGWAVILFGVGLFCAFTHGVLG